MFPLSFLLLNATNIEKSSHHSTTFDNTVYYQVQCALYYTENYAEIFPVRYTWKVAEKWFKMPFMMNKLAIINSYDVILEK